MKFLKIHENRQTTMEIYENLYKSVKIYEHLLDVFVLEERGGLYSISWENKPFAYLSCKEEYSVETENMKI